VNVLIVEGDFRFWRGFVLEEWKRLPQRRVLLSRKPKLWRARDYDDQYELPLNKGVVDGARLESLRAVLSPLAGACTTFVPAVGHTLEVQRALGLPLLTHLEPAAIRSKPAMVALLRDAGVTVPKTVSGRDPVAVIRDTLANLRLPVVVKPAELASGAGVSFARDEDELRRAIDVALSETLPFEVDGVATSVTDLYEIEPGVIVQEFIDGPEYSVEGFAAAGRVSVLALSETIQAGPPRFEKLGHLQPARIKPAERDVLLEYALGVTAALELHHSFFHIEVRMTSSGPIAIDVDLALPGDKIGRLLELRSGMNVGSTLLRLAAGQSVRVPERWVGAAGVRMAMVQGEGRLRHLRPPVLRDDREFAAFAVRPGDRVPAPRAGGPARIGYFLVAADETARVEDRLGELAGETQAEVG